MPPQLMITCSDLMAAVTARNSSNGYIGHTPSSSTHQTGGEEYIVLFKPGSSRKRSLPVMTHIANVLAILDLSPDNSDVTRIFNGTMFNGFAANMKSHCIDALNAMDDVDIIEKVQVVHSHQFQSPGTSRVSVDSQSTWGLQAISSAPQRIANLTSFSHQYMVTANSTLGQGVDVYVIDTGVNTAHEVFASANGGSRADLQSVLTSQVDDEGHGTHVSGTIGGTAVGVAPAVNLHGVKVLNALGAGSTMTILQGMESVAEAHAQRKSQPGFIGSVVNMSLGASLSQALNSAARALLNSGIHVVVSAGNEADDACNYSPSSLGGSNSDLISVGSIGATYRVSPFSNTGNCVDVYAPGERIVSSWITTNRSLQVLQGTSMSAPHVTGLVAYFMSNNPGLGQDTANMKAMVKATALTGAIQGNSNLLLANNGFQ
jgi:cerevisin